MFQLAAYTFEVHQNDRYIVSIILINNIDRVGNAYKNVSYPSLDHSVEGKLLNNHFIVFRRSFRCQDVGRSFGVG